MRRSCLDRADDVACDSDASHGVAVEHVGFPVHPPSGRPGRHCQHFKVPPTRIFTSRRHEHRPPNTLRRTPRRLPRPWALSLGEKRVSQGNGRAGAIPQFTAQPLGSLPPAALQRTWLDGDYESNKIYSVQSRVPPDAAREGPTASEFAVPGYHSASQMR